MNPALWIAKKNQLCNLIKKVSDGHGGDDIEWLRDYTKDVIDANKEDLDKALLCFQEIERQMNFIKTGSLKYAQPVEESPGQL